MKKYVVSVPVHAVKMIVFISDADIIDAGGNEDDAIKTCVGRLEVNHVFVDFDRDWRREEVTT